jgi:hypothetical protein
MCSGGVVRKKYIILTRRRTSGFGAHDTTHTVRRQSLCGVAGTWRVSRHRCPTTLVLAGVGPDATLLARATLCCLLECVLLVPCCPKYTGTCHPQRRCLVSFASRSVLHVGFHPLTACARGAPLSACDIPAGPPHMNGQHPTGWPAMQLEIP